jgi:hypothetical protein
MAGVASARVANRRALHFVYYSTTKKTVSGLTKCVRRTRGAHCGTVARHVRARARRAFKTCGEFSDAKARRGKNIDKTSSFCITNLPTSASRRTKNNFVRAKISTRRRQHHVRPCDQIFFHRRLCKRGVAGLNRSKNSESAPGDSRRSRLPPVRVSCRG